MISLQRTLEDLAYVTKRINGYFPLPAARAYLNLIRFAEGQLEKAAEQGHPDIDIEKGEGYDPNINTTEPRK